MQGKKNERVLPRHISDSHRSIIETNGPPKRVYQVWKGSNKFFLGGRLIFGPDVRSLVLTVCLIVIPVILFAVFVSHTLTKELHQFGDLVVAIPVIFAAYDIVVLFMTAGRDPGIVPRNSHPPEPENNGCTSPSSSEWTGSQNGYRTIPPTKDVFVNGIVVKVKYCHTCMLYRPPRCSHCSICNNCVERFDHHCPWVGQCIGRRNYRFFFMFVSSTTVLCLYVFAFCWVNLKMIMDTHGCSLWRAVVQSPVSFILIIYTFVAAWFVGGLTAFHIYLICTNQTTYENFRYRYDGKLNPYNHGCTRNIKDLFCSEIPRSMNDFRAMVKEDSAMFNSTTYSKGPIYSPAAAKRSFEYDSGEKRQAVAAEEFEDIQSQIVSTGGLERCGTLPPRLSWSNRSKGNWDISHDMEGLSTEFSSIELGYTAGMKNLRLIEAVIGRREENISDVLPQS